MTRTLVGQLITSDGHARHTTLVSELEQVGPLAYRHRPPELRTRSFAVDAGQVRDRQPNWIAVKLDHTDVIGHVDMLERHTDGSLWAVATVHGAIPPNARYLSPELRSYHDGTDIEITGVGLVERPAQILMQPVDLLDGDITSGITVTDWQHRHAPHADMLQRAHTATRERHGGPTLVRGVGSQRSEDDDAFVGSYPVNAGWVDPDGRPMPAPVGSGTGGRILRVS